MTKQTPGKIFLSEERGILETPQFNRYSTFNFGQYFNEHKAPFGSLYAVNEEIIAGSRNITLDVEEASHIITIPITGDVLVDDLQGHTSTVHVEEIQIDTIRAYSSFQLANLYKSDVITFLQIWIKAEKPVKTDSYQLFDFDFNAMENQLVQIAGTNDTTQQEYPFCLSMGRFAGRKEAVYQLRNKASKFFAYIIAGAFEIAGRLLHEKDGVALWGCEEVELEALSNHAIVVVLELPDVN